MEEILTPRERQVGRLLAQGMTTTQVAEELELSTSTVRNYVYHMGKVIPGEAPPIRRIASYFNDPERAQVD